MGTVVFADFGGTEPWLTRRELSEVSGYSVRTIEKFDREGLPSEQEGRHRLYKETVFRNWDRGRDRKGSAHAGQEEGQALRRQATR